MKIKQFEYKPLAHYSYAIVSNGEMAVVDPQRNPQEYYNYAKETDAKIVAVFETHPHADFVSSHLEIHYQTGATIYNSEKLGADYPHTGFDEGDEVRVGNTKITAINTPGHSPDSITIVAKEDNKIALFTGDTLFIKDVGRPDLREKAGIMKSKREELANMMFETVQNKFSSLPDHAIIYPAHGAGSLCGKSMSSASSSTLGEERRENWAFKTKSRDAFINHLLEGQPFIPNYFSYNVELNKTGADNLKASIDKVPFETKLDAADLIIDMREEGKFKKGHTPGSINIQAVSDNSQFETWLGAIVKPEETFSLILDSKENRTKLLDRVAKIGYEKQLRNTSLVPEHNLGKMPELDLEHFKNHLQDYTIIDVRNKSEVEDGKIFESALSYPLNELRDSVKNIPTDKPIVVHCAAGYRSAIGISLLQKLLNGVQVYDLSENVKKFID
ncbi:MAG: MBL fold metallo-hydrolase [Flavobacteriaceae bacterium]|nr:MBL fold metallo-hydrolase [Flavobacteriaceae bacterium]